VASSSQAKVNSAASAQRGSKDKAPSGKLSKKDKQSVRGISSADGKSKSDSNLVQTKATPNKANSAATPKMISDNGAFGVDAYRNGGFRGESGTGDPLIEKYVLSDYESNEEAAQLWLTARGTGDAIVTAYSRFFLQAVQESESEKYQVVETFTHFYSFFYGKRPSVYRYSGVLIDDENFRWANDFRFMYDNFFRGTQAAELDATVTVRYAGRGVNGLVLSLSASQQAMDPKIVQFSMDVLVLDYYNTKFSADIASLLKSKRAELLALKEKIQRELSMINKDIPTEQRLAAGQVFAGKKPASGVKGKGKKAQNPNSNLADPPSGSKLNNP
jgi:hypothetical protein